MVARVRSGLVAARKRQSHTRRSLAEALGVELSTVGRWERGTADPPPLMWPRIARELDISTDELVSFLAKLCCQNCGKVLAADSAVNLCAACRRDQHAYLDTPPQLDREFFDTPKFEAAFESQHIGRVLKTYRTHPYFLGVFTRPLSQENLGRWLSLTQAQVSKLENSLPDQSFESLQEWAAILHLPPDMLWFDLPGQTRLRSRSSTVLVDRVDVADTTADLSRHMPSVDFPGPRRQNSELTTVESVDRKNFLKATLGVGADALLAQAVPNSPQPDLAEILSGPTAHYRRMESAVPSDQLAPAVEAHLRLASHLVQQRIPTVFGYRVMSEIAGLAAWLAADRGDTATARRRYVDAIECAERAHHPLLVSYMTASLGHFAVETGNPSAGLKMIKRASGLLDRTAPNAARAWLESLSAMAHAALDDPEQATGALQLAETLVDREGPELRWPWVFKFDRAKVARYQASAFGRMGNIRSAAIAYKTAAPAITSPKPRALAQIEHAHVLAQSGDIGAGCALAITALDTARTYGSERVTTRVREFRAQPSSAYDRGGHAGRRIVRPLRSERSMTSIAITGHRGMPQQTESLIEEAIRKELDRRRDRPLVGLTCLADGADAIFARIVLDSGGSLHVIVPATKYRDALPESHHAVYDALIAKASEITNLDHSESDSSAHMDASVQMIRQADELFAVWDGKPARGYGGTANVVDAARERGLPVTVIWPVGSQRD